MNPSGQVVNIDAVRAMIADAKPIASAVVRREPVINGTLPGEWRRQHPGAVLPPDCPVTPLGINDGNLCFLDGIGQVRIIPTKSLGKLETIGLFGGELAYLEHHWPRFGKSDGKEVGPDGRAPPPPVNGFANDDLVADLAKACTSKGPWDAFSRLRGRGCWIDPDGRLVVHIGTGVISGGRLEPPGEIDDYVYPTRGQLPGPLPLREDLPIQPGPILRPILDTWNWNRPGVDPHLMLGWVGAAFLGAALPWRPMVFLTGGKGTGKSTLQTLVKGILGEWLVDTADTTAAGIYQRVGLDSVPIAVDELEAEADDKRAVAVLKLARLASSGAAMLRGGSDHKGTEFAARSAFLFSSINAPPMRAQDLSRMALLQLDKLRPDQPEPKLEARYLGIIGRAILHRLIKEWPRFEETYDAFAGELGAAGMDSRGQKQFGTLLACADMILHQGWNEERLRFCLDVEGDLVPWRDLLRPSVMLEFENATDNWLGCLRRLLSVRVEAWRNGTRTTVGQVLQEYVEGNGIGEMDITEANKLLGQSGLRIVIRARPETSHRQKWLVVQNNNPLVRQLYEGSEWAGLPGAGVWSGALRQAPKHLWMPRQERVNGTQERATLLSLDGLYGEGGLMAGEPDE